MSVEHEQRCERTIVTTVHEIDALKLELAIANARLERVRNLTNFPDLAAGYAGSAIVVDATLLRQALEMS